ncbi:MAG: pseudaminic acid synthase [Candidatus Omnitrophica bacterium]|nr:pseudaminic acid synthase [Candidatus Omnitrophota bacterium]
MIKLKNRIIGEGCPCYIIAEMSANHGQSFEKALKLIRAAKDAGADAIKLQTYTPDTMTMDCDNEYFQIGSHPLWGGKSLYQLYQQAYTPWEWHQPLQNEAGKLGLDFFSTPFDETAVDFLEQLDVPVYKIASFELVDDELLAYTASKRKPVILSTGMASEKEIFHAVEILRRSGAPDVALLKCVSAYPASPEEMNLMSIPSLQKEFQVVAGLSDHTLSSAVAVAAVALGAKIIEKHFTLSREDLSPDAAFSVTPTEFKKMVEDIRTVEKAIGQPFYGQTIDEKGSVKFRRSIFVVKDIKQGESFTRDNIRVIRPGNGLSPQELSKILGARAVRALKRGTPLTSADIRR